MRTLQDVRQKLPQFNHLSDDAIARALYRKYGNGTKVEDFWGSIGYTPKGDDPSPISAGIDTLQSGFQSGTAGLLKAGGFGEYAQGLEQAAADNRFRAAQEMAGSTSLSDVDGVGSGLSFAYETLANSLPSTGVSLAGAGAGAAIGSVVPGVGTGLGALGGAFLPGVLQYYGSGRERQREENQGQVVDEGRAALAGTGAAALDATLGKILPGVGGAYTGNLATRVGKGVAEGALIEGPTEGAQQALERWQAGLDLTSPEAVNELLTATAGGALAGGTFGGAFGSRPGANPSVSSDISPDTQEDVRVDSQPAAEPEADGQLDLFTDEPEEVGSEQDPTTNPTVAKEERKQEIQEVLTSALPTILADPAFTKPFSVRDFMKRTGVDDSTAVSKFLTSLAKDDTVPVTKSGAKYLVTPAEASAPEAAVAEQQVAPPPTLTSPDQEPTPTLSGSVNSVDTGAGLEAVPEILAGDTNATDVSRETQVAGVKPELAAPEPVKPAGIKAWHGSPHKFDRFSLEHIGKGEGQQVYGHGLYFAEKRGTAEWYRNQLSDAHGVNTVKYDGKSLTDDEASTGNKDADSALVQVGGDLDAAVKWAEQNGIDALNTGKDDQVDRWETAANFLRNLDSSKIERPGALYELTIDTDKDALLDWDAPLSRQPERVRKALSDLGVAADKWESKRDGAEFSLGKGDSFQGVVTRNSKGKYVARVADGRGTRLLDEFEDPDSAKNAVEDEALTGEQAYKRLARMLGEEHEIVDTSSGSYNVDYYRDENTPAASEALKKAGIPGIKYLDGGSRTAGDGTRNFVMFDDSLINIDARYRKIQQERQRKTQQLDKSFESLAKRLAPGAAVQTMNSQAAGSSIIAGKYTSTPELGHVISLATDAGDPLASLRHESIHYLKNAGVITQPEWSRLAKEATRAGWLDRYGIASKYPDLSPDQQLEEAVAEHFAVGFNGGFKGWPGWLRNIAQRVRQFFRLAKNDVKRIFGRDASAADIMAQIEAGRMASRAGEVGASTSMDRRSEAPKDPVQQRIDAAKGRILAKRPTTKEKLLAKLTPPEPDWTRRDELKRKLVDRAQPFRRNEEIVSGRARLGPDASNSQARKAGDRFEADISGLVAAHNVSLANGILVATATQKGVPVFAKAKSMGQYDGYVTVAANDADSAAYHDLTKTIYEKGLEGDAAFYAAAVRAQRLLKLGKERLLSNEDIKLGLLAGERNPEIKQWQQAYQKYNRKLLDFAVSTGVITKEKADLWSRDGDYYPFYRHLEELEKAGSVQAEKGPKTVSGLASAKQVKELKGGTDPLFDDPLAAQIKNARWWIEAGLKNIAALRNVDIAAQLGFAEKISESQRRTGDNVAHVYRDGKHELWRVTDAPTFDALSSLSSPDLGFWGKLLSKPADLLRATVTSMPDFIVANMLRDIPQAWALSGGMNPASFITNVFKNYVNALRGSGSAATLAQAGYGGGFDLAGKDSFDSADVIKEKMGIGTNINPIDPRDIGKLLKRGFRGMQTLSAASDAATRSAIYEQALKETGNPAEAIYRSIDYLDFSRHGASKGLRALTAVVPFLNARIQGLESLYQKGLKPVGRLLYAPFSKQKLTAQEARQFAAVTAKIGILMAGALLLHNAMQDDEEYQQADDYLKDGNLLLKAEWFGMGKGLVAIPKPFELGSLFMTLPVRLHDAMLGNMGEDRDLAESIINMTINTFKVNPIPQAALPVVEALANYSFFTGRPVVGKGLEGLRAQDQYDDNTSEAAKAIGDTLGVSPAKVDHILKGYTGTMGRYILSGLDYVTSGDNAPATNLALENEFSRRFIKLPETTGSKQLSDFYELRTNLQQTMRSVRQYMQEGRIDDARSLVNDNIALLSQQGTINTIDKALQQIRKYVVAVKNSDRPPAEKRALLDRLAQIRQQVVARTVPRIREATLN